LTMIPDKHYKVRNIIRKILFVVLGAGGIFATYLLGKALSMPPNELSLYGAYEESTIEVEEEETAEPLPTPVAAMTEEEIFNVFAGARIDEETANGEDEDDETPPVLVSPIDFEALWAINDHVYAWITVPGTIIDYPILQHPTDDTRYLNYNIDGSFGLPGCIYTEKMNAKDFSDPHTVIYGHNMKNGTMFAQLHEFRKSDFFNKNRDIIIYKPDGTELRYMIFAAYIYDDRHLMYSFNFDNKDVYGAYLKSIFDRRDLNANIDKDMVVTNEDRIITLVTCISGQDDKRLLVQAVLIE